MKGLRIVVAHPPVVHSTLAKLSRSEIAGVNANTLAVALDRAERDRVAFAELNERQMAIALLERVGFPETANELYLFLNSSHSLTASTLVVEEITDTHAPPYMTWLAGFLNDPEQTVQKNARFLLRWLVTNRQAAIQAKPNCLDAMRRVADDPENHWRNAAFVAYTLAVCGTMDDYDRVIRQAESVIEQDRENVALIAESLYRMYPPALINALQYFIENTPAKSKQFAAGIQLLEKVAEIEDKSFWKTYYDDLDRVVNKIGSLAEDNHTIERILDRIEKHLALVDAD